MPPSSLVPGASVWSWIAALDLFPLRCHIYKSHEVVEVTTPVHSLRSQIPRDDVFDSRHELVDVGV